MYLAYILYLWRLPYSLSLVGVGFCSVCQSTHKPVGMNVCAEIVEQPYNFALEDECHGKLSMKKRQGIPLQLLKKV